MTTGISSLPRECLDLVMRRLPNLDLLKCGRVCKLWNEVLEEICKQKYEQDFGGRLLVKSSFPLTTAQSCLAYNWAICLARRRCWEKKALHPSTLYAARNFLQPGQADIVMGSLAAPVEFQEIQAHTYLVQCGVKARLTTLPLVTHSDPYGQDSPQRRDFPEELGAIVQIAWGKLSLFVLAGNDKKRLHVLSHELTLLKSFEGCSKMTSVAYDAGLLVVGTKEGSVVGRLEKKGTLRSAFSHCIGQEEISWVGVYAQRCRRIVIAIQGNKLVIVRNLFETPRIHQMTIELVEGSKPLFHGSHLIWKGPEGFIAVDLNNDTVTPFPEWVYVNRVAEQKLLVQDNKGQFFLLDEQMKKNLIGALSMVVAADYREGYLAVAFDPPGISVYRPTTEELQEIYRDTSKTVPGEKIIQISFSMTGTIAYSTNNGRFIYGCPIFEGLSNVSAL